MSLPNAADLQTLKFVDPMSEGNGTLFGHYSPSGALTESLKFLAWNGPFYAQGVGGGGGGGGGGTVRPSVFVCT